ncbi:MAG: hypothetical protein MR902_07925 [Campylobacter sp.]|nr:hypothetical protein [Campylobacter sp.]
MPFFKIYENSDKSPNIRLEIAQNGSFDFRIYLFEEMSEFIPYFIVAFENMQNIGLGREKKRNFILKKFC